jgi:hypothetical protein
VLICEDCCAAYVDNWLPTFRDGISVPTSGEKQFSWTD